MWRGFAVENQPRGALFQKHPALNREPMRQRNTFERPAR